MEFTAEIKKATEPIYQKISKAMPEIEWSVHAPYIYKINKLKKEKNAVVLAHNYQTPEIYHGISDFSADSLALAVEAAKTKADIIVMCGVHFMAETAKLMSPEKKVLLPDMKAGCSLSSSITGDDVRNLKKKYPGVPVVSYVNTSADVKAETDVCCTSANALKIVNSLGYFDFQKTLLGANKVITDSGGVTREAFFAKKLSLIPMKNSWWQEVEDSGWARCFENIDDHFIDYLNSSIKPTTYPENLFGSGDISKKGWDKILNYFNKNIISKTESWHTYGAITNLPNKKTNDFSYNSYREILNNFKNKKYKFQKFSDYKNIKKNNSNIFLRHDIDLTLDKVIQIARIEAELKVHSTFFFMTNSPFYNIYSSKGHELIEELIKLDHHIGLHFHSESYKNLFLEQDINIAVKKEIKNMENIFDLKIDAVSFHRPNKFLLKGSSLLTSPIPHTYMKEFTKEMDYCSDSSGEWKFGSPIERKSFKNNQDMHLLIHPVWWNESITNPFLVLQKFILENKKNIEKKFLVIINKLVNILSEKTKWGIGYYKVGLLQ